MRYRHQYIQIFTGQKRGNINIGYNRYLSDCGAILCRKIPIRAQWTRLYIWYQQWR